LLDGGSSLDLYPLNILNPMIGEKTICATVIFGNIELEGYLLPTIHLPCPERDKD